jgi:acetyl-CoA carboxylase biotin carboxyl carrier protein
MAHADEVAQLIALVDRLEALLERSSLAELEVEVGATTLILRSPEALASPPTASSDQVEPAPDPSALASVPAEPETSIAHAVLAPLTGVFYRSPSPGAEPYVHEGGPVNAGQVIGLIEAMKLFNEIKSDAFGTVRRLVAGDGDLVKAKQVLIEVDPA